MKTIEELIAVIDRDLEENGNITDARITELHDAINNEPIEDLVYAVRRRQAFAQRAGNPGGAGVIKDIADTIRQQVRREGRTGSAADIRFYELFNEVVAWGGLRSWPQ